MSNQSRKQNNHNARVSAVDSFVVDLRSLISSPKTIIDEKGSILKNKKTKNFSLKSFSFSKIKKAPSFLKFAENKILNNRVSIFSKKPKLFSLKFLKRRGLKSLYKRKHFVLDLPFNKMERHFFANFTVLRWAYLQKLHLLSDTSKKNKEAKSAYLLTWYRSMFAFMAALVFIILPFKLLAYFKVLDFQNLRDNVVTRSLSAFDNLAAASDGASQLDLAAASSNFARASLDFSSAQTELSRVDDWLLNFATLSSDPKIKLAASGKKFLAAGRAAATVGQHLSAAGAILLESEGDKDWGRLIDAFVEHGSLALASAQELQLQLNSIDINDLPLEYRDQIISFRSQVDVMTDSLSLLLNSAQEIKEFLGVSLDKRYLLVFQNNAEMRGSGGFFGSYALVDIRDGKIRKLEVPAGGSYDTEAGMKAFIQAPQPLWLVSPRWYFWDANWWPDWPTSARSLMWFYEKSDGPTVDGVISFTPDVLEDLLRITGPIDMQEEYSLTVSADNFWELIQATVEKDNLIKNFPEEVAALPDSPENQPKKIIGDLMAEVMARLPQTLTLDNLAPLLQGLEHNLRAKNIMLYFSDPALQAKISYYGLDGAILPSKQDYLMITHTNIAGQKSDRKMIDRVEHSIQILSDNSVIDTLTIYRTHTGLKNEMLSGVRNVDWLRVYVPQGSQLLEASGFRAPDASYFEEPEADWEKIDLLERGENQAMTDLSSGTKIYTENSKTVFANWLMIDPGETGVIKFKYRLPFKLKAEVNDSTKFDIFGLDRVLNKNESSRAPLSLLVQKQPGAKAADYSFELQLPSAWRQIWNYPENVNWQSALVLDRDIMRATLIEK